MRVKPKLPLFSPSFSHTQPHKRRKTRKRLCKVQKKKEILNRSFLDSTDESEEEGNNTINFVNIFIIVLNKLTKKLFFLCQIPFSSFIFSYGLHIIYF